MVHGQDGTVGFRLLTPNSSGSYMSLWLSFSLQPTPQRYPPGFYQNSSATSAVLHGKNPNTVTVKKYSTYNQKHLKTSGPSYSSVKLESFSLVVFTILLSILDLTQAMGLPRTSYASSSWGWGLGWPMKPVGLTCNH